MKGETIGFAYYKRSSKISNKQYSEEELKTIPYIDDSGKLINVKIGNSNRTIDG